MNRRRKIDGIENRLTRISGSEANLLVLCHDAQKAITSIETASGTTVRKRSGKRSGQRFRLC